MNITSGEQFGNRWPSHRKVASNRPRERDWEKPGNMCGTTVGRTSVSRTVVSGTWTHCEWTFVRSSDVQERRPSDTNIFVYLFSGLITDSLYLRFYFLPVMFIWFRVVLSNERWSANPICSSRRTVQSRHALIHNTRRWLQITRLRVAQDIRASCYFKPLGSKHYPMVCVCVCVCERVRERQRECTNSDSFRNNLALFLVIQNFRNPYSVESSSFLLEVDLSRMKSCEPLQCTVKCEAPRTGTGSSQGQGTWSEVAVGHHGQWPAHLRDREPGLR
jgi:hypothetical protein